MKVKVLTILSLIVTVLFYLFWWKTLILEPLDLKIYDRLSYTLASHDLPDSTVVVEIDDKSLKAFGQWPWPRMITAELINTIADASPNVIAMDIIFSENDRTSPNTLQMFYRNFYDLNISIEGIPEQLRDNDRILAAALGRTKVVLPVFSDTTAMEKKCNLFPWIAKRNNVNIDSFQNMENLVCSLPRYQQYTSKTGHIHAIADADGTLRRLSLLMRHNNLLIPTLGLAAISTQYETSTLSKHSLFSGEVGLDINHNPLIMNSDGEVLLHFYPYAQYMRISAYDILSHRYDTNALKGKVVFIGATAFGLDTWHMVSDGTIRPGVYTHATMVENILHHDLKVQPNFYKPFNLSLSFAAAITLSFLMLRKRYLSVVISFLMLLITASLATAWAWNNSFYPSVGYFLIPLISYLFGLSLLMFFIDYRNKKRFIEDLQRSTEQKQRLKTALDKSESEIEYQKAILFQQSKLAAMGEMIDNIAHQWRQPLNMLSVIVQDVPYAYASGRMDEKYTHSLSADSMEQIVFMSQTIDDFRNFVKPNQQNAPFDLNQSVEESIQLLSGMFESHHISVNVSYTDKPITVFGSSSEFKQVIINLLQNAKDAFGEKQPKNPNITIRIFSDITYAMVTIEDNGGGINNNVIDRIFEPYFTTKEEGKGSGIGLYMSYAIIRTKMGGMIEASNVDNGTIFIISLPLYTLKPEI
jgi:signal transduction histidine kinase